MSFVLRNLAALKVAVLVLVVADLAALAAFSVQTETTTTTTTPAVAASTVPDRVAAPPAEEEPLEEPPASTGTPLGTPTTGTTTPIGDSGDAPAKPAETPAEEPETEPTDDDVVRAAACPLPIETPENTGGLQSLISFAPAFGPFKDEAFGAAAAYQPVLQLIGPVLAKYPEVAPLLEPALQPLLDQWAAVLDTGWKVVEPFYAPVRPQVLEAEAQVAKALAPAAQQLASSELGGCIVAVQALLLGGGDATVDPEAEVAEAAALNAER